MEPSDEALVLACRDGDPAAWETLVARYQRLIYTIARRAGLDEEQAADVFQHAFAMLVEQLHRIEHPALIGAWLVTTARREAWHACRRAKITANSVAAHLDQPDGPIDNAPLPDEVLLQLEEQHRVRTAVAALDERCRKLLTLLFYQPTPMPYEEIAATLGIAAGSVGPIRARCLQRLRKLLGRL